MATAKKGDMVVIEYTVSTSGGRVVGGTAQSGPQTLSVGGAEIFPQIEAALEGMDVGTEKDVIVSSVDAFGPRREDLVVQIPNSQLPQGEIPKPGMTLSAGNQDGSTINLVIREVSEEGVVADGNHPLAGEDLHFALTLVEIKQAA